MGRPACSRVAAVRAAFVLGLVGLLGACAVPAQSPASSTAPGSAPLAPTAAGQPRAKTITIGVTASVDTFGILGSSSGTGGWPIWTELYADALVTSDVHSRQPIARLANGVPSLDDGSIVVLPDGRMQVTYHVRPGITWQDGAPFTAQDLVFSVQLNGDRGLPNVYPEAVRLMDSAEAPDDGTFVVTFKRPYYLGGEMGLKLLWPEPQHLLGDAYTKYLRDKNPDDVVNLPYWSTGYVHLGPFKLTAFESGEGLTFQAYDGYFLGRPKVDTVQVRFFNDTNVLYSNLLGGTVDMSASATLSADQMFQLKDQWESTGQGRVFIGQGTLWFLSMQSRPAVQTEPAMLDPRMRMALYMAIDRDTLTESLLHGARDQAAYSILPASDQLYDVTREMLRPYGYDPNRAKAQLADLGWQPGANGALRSTADGHTMQTSIWTTPGEDRDIATMADVWRKLGIAVDELVIPAARVRDLEYRASYPGWEYSSAAPGDGALGRLDGPAASAANGWSGNRGGYEDPQAQALNDAYRASLSIQDQRQAMGAIASFFVQQLPYLPIYFNPFPVAVRGGIQAFDDLGGAVDGFSNYGTLARNSYLWDVGS